MVSDKRKEERRLELINELKGELNISDKKLNRIIDHLVELEYRRERSGTWILDNHSATKKYVRWVCSSCAHWQSAQRHIMSEQIFYMNYCPFCGAQMTLPDGSMPRLHK
ncbi:MAG: hypothetical protein E7668_06940 [Ruminococcaceae bacterium]|nr:hypothetical protein [Oscillospiraceae bacterium]